MISKNLIAKYYRMIKRALKKGDFFEKVFCLFLIKIGYSNYIIKDLEIRNKISNSIELDYHNLLKSIKIDDVQRTREKVAWTCWLQGIDNAPEIVKTCINSQKKYIKGYRHVIITAENYQQYVELPSYVIQKWREGIISHAHFTDIIRTNLLIRYGGIWLDSTVLLTGEIPPIILNESLFMFTNDNAFDLRRNHENWFIVADSNSKVLKYILLMLYGFWKRENSCREYFIWNLFAYHAVEKYKEEVEYMVVVPHNICYLMNKCIEGTYKEINFNNICKLSNIHKLSYKDELLDLNTNSIYKRLLREYL